VSIFVNPTQFNDPKDCATYPQPLEADRSLCAEAGVDAVFLPTKDHFYPDGYRYRVTENAESTALEGEFRPGHFDGVLTVVLKLFNVVGPCRAYFGEKDWQQLQLVKGMADALFLPVEVVPCPIVRDFDGLALSSRNVRLSPAGRAKAAAFPRILREAETAEAARDALDAEGFLVEYVVDRPDRRLAVVQVEGVRLLDNLSPAEIAAKVAEVSS
jgi:pantoate--beta-alanine ligase